MLHRNVIMNRKHFGQALIENRKRLDFGFSVNMNTPEKMS